MKVRNTADRQAETSNGYFVRITMPPYMDVVDIWIGRRGRDGTFLLKPNGDGHFLEEKYDGMEQKTPSLRMPMFLWEALSETLQKEIDVTESPRAEGELEATKYHLEDLRYLLKIHDRVVIRKAEQHE